MHKGVWKKNGTFVSGWHFFCGQLNNRFKATLLKSAF